jgi:hypothetical protein
VRIEPIRILKSLAFALATLAATGVLVAAGLNEGAPVVVAGGANAASPAK